MLQKALQGGEVWSHPGLSLTHPPDDEQNLAVAEEHEQQRQQQAEDEEAHHVGDAARRASLPLHGAGRARPLRPVAAPAQEGRKGPQQGVKPGARHTQPGLAEVRHISFGGTQHSRVALVRQDGQGHQGYDAWSTETRAEQKAKGDESRWWKNSSMIFVLA